MVMTAELALLQEETLRSNLFWLSLNQKTSVQSTLNSRMQRRYSKGLHRTIPNGRFSSGG